MFIFAFIFIILFVSPLTSPQLPTRIFGSWPLYVWIEDTFRGGKDDIYYTPMSERKQRSRCHGRNNSLPDLAGDWDYSFTHYGSLYNNSVDYCRGMVVPISLNPRWEISNFTIAVGISGDLDSKTQAEGGTSTDDDITNYDNWEYGYFRGYWDDGWNEQVNVYMQAGHDVPDISNMSWTGTPEMDSMTHIGGCGGCPAIKEEWNGRWQNMQGNCSQRTGNVHGGWRGWSNYQAVEGRCQAECDGGPYFETCVPQIRGVQDNWGSWKLNRPLNQKNTKNNIGWPFFWQPWVGQHGGNPSPNNFSVVVLSDRAVNIRSCQTGLVAQIKVGVDYVCDGTLSECSASEYDFDGSVTDGGTGECVYDDGYVNAYPYGVVFLIIFATLDGLFVLSCCCCIGAACGMCCTKTPEDDSGEFQTKKKGSWF